MVTAVDNLGYLGQNHQFTINWTTEQVKDDESGIFTFQVALGSTPGLADVNGWTDVGLVNTYTFAGLNLLPGATYYAMVRAVNSANLTGNSNSTKGTVIDLTPPSKPVIVVEGSKTFDLEKLHAQWFSVDHQDPKLTYRVTIRDSNDCSNVPDDEWMDMGPANGGTFMYNLELGSYYYICVQARNRAGFYSKISKSDGGVKGCRGTALNEFSDNFNNSDSISVGNYYNQWKNWYSQDEWTTLGIGGIQPKFASMGGIFGDDSPASNIITNGREDWVEASLYGQIIVFKPGAGAGFAFRFQDRRNYILFYQTDDGRAPNGMINQPGSYLYAIVDGTPNLIAERRDITFTVGLTHQVKIDTSDQYIRVWFDNDGNGNLELNELVFNENSKLLVHGAIGLYAYGSNSMIFDNISVTAKRGTVLMDIEPENEKIEWFIDTPPRIIGTPKDENGNEIKVPILEGKHFLFVGCRIVGKFIVTDCGELWEDPQNKLDPDFAEIIGDKMFFKYRFGDKTVCKTGGDSTSGQSLTALDYENGGNNQSSFDSSEAGSFSNTGLIDHFNIIKEGKFAAGSFNTLATGATAQLVAPPWLFKKAENILWEQISGDKAILSNTRAADPMIIAPKKPQELYFMLTGTRSNGKSISETVKLQVKASAPILTDGKVIRTDFPAALTAYRLQNVARIDIPQSITPALIPFTGLIDTASLPDFTKSTSPEEAPVRLLIDKNGIFKPVTAVFDFIKLPFHPEKPQFYLAVAPLEGWKKGYGYSLNITQKLKIFEQISISLPTQNLWQENAVIPLAIPK